MALIIIGLVISYAGFGSIIYGVYLNNNVAAQVDAFFKNLVNRTTGAPGSFFVWMGLLAVLIGTALIIFRAYRYSKRRSF